MTPSVVVSLPGPFLFRHTVGSIAAVAIDSASDPWAVSVPAPVQPGTWLWTSLLSVAGGAASCRAFLITSYDNGLTWAVCGYSSEIAPGEARNEILVVAGLGPLVAVAWKWGTGAVGTATGSVVLASVTTFDLAVVDGITVDTTYATADPATTTATQAWVTQQLQSLTWKSPVRAVTAAALPAYTRSNNVLTADAVGAFPAVDGVALGLGERLLLKDGAADADNGIYTLTAAGGIGTPWTLTRAADADTDADVVSNIACLAEEGTTNGGLLWRLSSANPVALNTTALTFASQGGGGSAIPASARWLLLGNYGAQNLQPVGWAEAPGWGVAPAARTAKEKTPFYRFVAGAAGAGNPIFNYQPPNPGARCTFLDPDYPWIFRHYVGFDANVDDIRLYLGLAQAGFGNTESPSTYGVAIHLAPTHGLRVLGTTFDGGLGAYVPHETADFGALVPGGVYVVELAWDGAKIIGGISSIVAGVEQGWVYSAPLLASDLPPATEGLAPCFQAYQVVGAAARTLYFGNAMQTPA